MKIIQIAQVLVLVFSSCFFITCKKSKPDLFSSEYQNVMRQNALAEAAFDDVLKVAENILMKNGNAKIETTGAPLGCFTDIDTVVTGPTTKRYTINFPSQCTSYDGKARSGTMILDLTGANYNVAGATLRIRFQNFSLNGNLLQGQLLATTLDSVTYKIVVSDESGTDYASVTVAELNLVSTWKSTHKRTIIEGRGDVNLINNKYTISSYDANIATFEGVTTDSKYYKGNPSIDLLLDYSCMATGTLRYPIAGEIFFRTDEFIRKVNYGVGNCEYSVQMIAGGSSKDFNLY